MNNLFNPEKGKKYNVILHEGRSTSIFENQLTFLRCYEGYKAPCHGVAEPDDYICYKFSMRGKHGIVYYYQYQIKNIVAL